MKVTADWGGVCSTTSFAVRRYIWWRFWDWWDEDYIISGHKGPRHPPGYPPTITPLNMPINQPTPGHEAGTVKDNVGTSTYADAARVGISDARVRPYIHIGGSPNQPVLRPVFDAADPKVGDIIWISAGRTGLTWSVHVMINMTLDDELCPEGWPWGELKNQYLIIPRWGNPMTQPGDSGSPYWTSEWCPTRGIHGARIHGLHAGRVTIHAATFMVLSPVSGVKHEFPDWEVWVKE